MSSISDAIQSKCLTFSDRIIKLNDYLLEQAASKRYDGGSQRADRRYKTQTSYVRHQTSDLSQPSSFIHHTSLITSSISHQTSSILPMNVETDFIKEALDAGLYKQGVTMYLQLHNAKFNKE